VFQIHASRMVRQVDLVKNPEGKAGRGPEGAVGIGGSGGMDRAAAGKLSSGERGRETWHMGRGRRGTNWAYEAVNLWWVLISKYA